MAAEKGKEDQDALRGDLEALRAHQLRADAGHETPGRVGAPTDGVLVQVCMECGKEYTFDDEEPPSDLKCEKCGGTVFRSFFEPLGDDEAEQDFRDMTERDLATNDPEGDTTRGDIVDLNNL